MMRLYDALDRAIQREGVEEDENNFFRIADQGHPFSFDDYPHLEQNQNLTIVEEDENKMYIGTFFDIPNSNVQEEDEDEEEDTNPQAIDQQEEDAKEIVMQIVIPNNITPPDNVEDAINVLGLLNAIFEYQQEIV